jgi:hypothetical protein
MKFLLSTIGAFALCTGAIAQPLPKLASSQPAGGQLYRNAAFNFSYQVPYGWVDRTKEMQEGSDPSKGEVLLAIFERPPQAAGDTVNSAVLIASERAASYPGVKKADDYLGPLTELTTAKGFTPEGDPSEAQVGTQRLVRIDFSKKLNDKLTMHQSTLVLLTKGQIVSFTFIAESADSVNSLMDGLSFSPSKSKGK